MREVYTRLDKETHEFAELATVLDLDVRLSTLVCDLEWPVLHVALDLGIIELATNETLCVEDGVFRVRVECILRAVTNTERLLMSQEGEAK